MPVVHSRRLRIALWSALALLIVPAALSAVDIAGGDAGAWVAMTALALVAATLGVALSRQSSFEVRALEKERVSAALAASEAKFAGILSIAADAIISVDAQQRIVHFNRGAEEIFQWTAQEMTGRTLDALLPPRFRAGHPAHMAAFARSDVVARRMGERREIFGLRRDGSEFPAEASISKLETPDGWLFTVVLRDITARKRAEDDERFLAEAAARLAQSLEPRATLGTIANVAVPRLGDVCILDVATSPETFERIVEGAHAVGASSAFAALRAHPLTPDSPSPAVDVMRRREPALVECVDAEWLEGNEEAPLAQAWIALGARSLLFMPLASADRVHGVLTLVSTAESGFWPERRVLATKYGRVASAAIENARLYQLARNASRARDEVLGVVSHDLRNPISAIAMCARALNEGGADDPAKRTALLETIAESTDWINRLIQDLLDVANIERGQLSLGLGARDAAELVLQARHMFDVEASDHDITLDAAIATGLPLIDADGARIVQVLGNLLRNAVKFTPDGGRITISAERGSAGGVVFAVADTGPGIPEANLANVFERYWQSSDGARTKGSGLGLSIAKGIVDAHRGSITVQSTVGAGTTFRFWIPGYAGRL